MSFDQHNKTKAWLKQNAMDLYLRSETRQKENPMLGDPGWPAPPPIEMTEAQAREIVQLHQHLEPAISDNNLHSDMDRAVYLYLKAQWFLKGIEHQRSKVNKFPL